MKIGRYFSIISMSIFIFVGLELTPHVVASERSLEITGMRLNPEKIPVNQPFDIEVSFRVTDLGSESSTIETVFYFIILKDNKTVFTSDSYPINTRNGKVISWVQHMNPVSVIGRYTIVAYVSYEQLLTERRIDLAIGVPPKLVSTPANRQANSLMSQGGSSPIIAGENSIHLRHILIKKQSDAYRILYGMNGLSGNELREKFILEAKSSSVDVIRKNGGDIGMVKRGQMVLEFENAAFSLSPGTITTSPVKTVYGYHIIYREK